MVACEDDAAGGLVDVGTRSSGKAIGSVPRCKARLMLSKRKIVERLGRFWIRHNSSEVV